MSGDCESSRRSFIAGASASTFAGALLPRTAWAQTKLRPVTMRLDWLFQGPNVGFIVAREKGFYRAAGLDVEIGPGKGSGSTAQLIATKAAQFGFSDGYVVGNSVAKGLNIKMVAAVYRRNPAAVVVLAESSIREPKDLEGKTIAIPTGSAQFQQWPAFVNGCKLDATKLRVINIDPAGSPPALISGQIQAIAGFAQGYVPSIELRGNKEARVFWYADCGVRAVSNGIIVHEDLVKEDPELIRTFVAASIRGFLYGREHPHEAAEIVKKYYPSSEVAITQREMEWSWKTWVTPATAGKPLGWMSAEDWDATVAALKQYGGVTGSLTADQLYTNDFVPSGPEFMPPAAG
jgi:NitT/TauT family transport system substrate-binding protein